MHSKETHIKNRVCNYYFDNLVKKQETENILINEKNYKDLVIYFRLVYSKLIKMLLHYHELMGNIKEHEGKIFDD